MPEIDEFDPSVPNGKLAEITQKKNHWLLEQFKDMYIYFFELISPKTVLHMNEDLKFP